MIFGARGERQAIAIHLKVDHWTSQRLQKQLHIEDRERTGVDSEYFFLLIMLFLLLLLNLINIIGKG